jgi:hypothetical protein
LPVTVPDQSNALNSNYPEVELNQFHNNNPNTGEQKKRQRIISNFLKMVKNPKLKRRINRIDKCKKTQPK